jgi:hypothetical protein
MTYVFGWVTVSRHLHFHFYYLFVDECLEYIIVYSLIKISVKEIYVVDLDGNAGRGRRRRTFLSQIGEVLEKGQARSTRNRRACMRNLMTVEEAIGVCKDRSKWKEVISVNPKGKRRDVMYVCFPLRVQI